MHAQSRASHANLSHGSFAANAVFMHLSRTQQITVKIARDIYIRDCNCDVIQTADLTHGYFL
jgi:hypothetical protein